MTVEPHIHSPGPNRCQPETGPGDRTLFQIEQAETDIASLRPEDKQEALIVAASAKDGFQQVTMHPIGRDNSKATLGTPMMLREAKGRFLDFW